MRSPLRRFSLRALLLVVGVIVATVGTTVPGHPADAAAGAQLCSPAGGPSSSFTVTGWVAGTHDLTVLFAQPAPSRVGPARGVVTLTVEVTPTAVAPAVSVTPRFTG